MSLRQPVNRCRSSGGSRGALDCGRTPPILLAGQLGRWPVNVAGQLGGVNPLDDARKSHVAAPHNRRPLVAPAHRRQWARSRTRSRAGTPSGGEGGRRLAYASLGNARQHRQASCQPATCCRWRFFIVLALGLRWLNSRSGAAPPARYLMAEFICCPVFNAGGGLRTNSGAKVRAPGVGALP